MREDGMAGEGLLVVSPHFDDAVLSCGCWLAGAPGATVVTVFGGRPDPGMALTRWDAACGFEEGADVVGRRREEDRAALALLAAHPVWLDFRDAQYGPSPAREAVTRALAVAIAKAGAATVAFPLGLFHLDHVLAADATLALVERMQAIEWVVYEDALYRSIEEAAWLRRESLQQSGWRFEPFTPTTAPDAPAAKRAALACYPSQLRGLATPGMPDVRDALNPERYHRVVAVRQTSLDLPMAADGRDAAVLV
jgi:LmbE family N-acetylglucosaminyl deacetylase